MTQAGFETVLVVDDEFLVRSVAVDMLRDLGCEVLEASDGVDALNTLLNRPDVSLLFSDCRMPRMGGPELAEAVARLRPDLRIVLTAGYVETAPTRWPLLRKPYRFADLAGIVDQTGLRAAA